MMGRAQPFFEEIRRIIDQLETTQDQALTEAAKLVADSLTSGGIIHVFGTGHSHMLAEELFFRAGGFVALNAILDSGLMLHESALGSTALERLEGYASVVLGRYEVSPKDVMIIASNSGRNPVPIEMAIEAKRRGLAVIALTSIAASQASLSRHSSGKRLYEVADVVLDNCGVKGDALVKVEGLDERICPSSTITGAILLQALVYETVIELLKRGEVPEILVSANVDEDSQHRQLFKRYRDRIRHK